VTVLAGDLLGSPIHSFTGVFRGEQYDESEFARIIAERSRTIHHEVFPGPKELPESLPNLVYHLDEPAAGPGLYPQYIVAKEARKHVKVILTGHGGDEMFGGYARYMVAYLEQCLKGAIFETQEEGSHLVTLNSLIGNLPLLRQYTPMIKDFFAEGMFETMDSRYFRLIDRGRGLRSILSPELAGRGVERTRQEFSDLFNRSGSVSYFNKMTFFDMRTLLPALLHVEDRVSMSVSLESRVPLLDHRIVELVASLSPLIKFAGGQSKAIFKKAMTNVVPNDVLLRKDKMGFPFPINQWLKGELREFTFDNLAGSRFRQRGWFDSSKVEHLLNSGAFDRGVWGLLNLELWAQAFFDDKRYESLSAPCKTQL
jgi:asparagine synthase (glutamine-hydrolysing)